MAIIGPPQAAYALFLLIGLVTLRYHWHVLFDLDRSGLIQYNLETLLLVPPLAVLACVGALASDDRMLRVLATATGLVIALTVLVSYAPASKLATDVLLALGQVYTALCLIAWPAGRYCRSWRAGIGLLTALGVIIVPLSLAWDPHRQALVGFRSTPRPLELQLYAAAEAGNLARVQALLAAGARADVKGEGGWDALMHAASAGQPAIVRALLADGANANTREDKAGFRRLPPPAKPEVATPAAVQVSGRTALINAAVRGHTDVVRALLAAGADPGWRDVSGRTARDWAEWAHRPDVVLLLQGAQAGR